MPEHDVEKKIIHDVKDYQDPTAGYVVNFVRGCLVRRKKKRAFVPRQRNFENLTFK